jgi:kynurenine formamidase
MAEPCPVAAPEPHETGDEPKLPDFADLPTVDGQSERHSWNVYGYKDDLGALNNLTPDRVARGASEVHTGERVSLQLPPELPDPPFYGRPQLRHQIIKTGRNTWDDRLDHFYPQRATQWDGFRHFRFREHGFYSGLTLDPPEMGERLSIHHWSRQGVIGRGVLLDVASYLDRHGKHVDAFNEYAITADELRAVGDHQEVEVRAGDILCVRTAWATRYKQADYTERAALARAGPAFIGLSAGESTAALLWDWHVSAVAADNPAVECAPGSAADGSLHRRVLVQLGIPLGELFDFDELSAACRRDGRWSFFFVSVPLAIIGGVGSPASPVAIR